MKINEVFPQVKCEIVSSWQFPLHSVFTKGPGAFGERCDEAVEADRIDCFSALHFLEDLHGLCSNARRMQSK